MRTSAPGNSSTMAVAIAQILRFAPSIRGPIEPVVSSTKATSTTGLALASGPEDSVGAANADGTGDNATRPASTRARVMLANMGVTLWNASPPGMFHDLHDWRGSELRLTT